MSGPVIAQSHEQRATLLQLLAGMSVREIADQRNIATDGVWAQIKRIRDNNDIGTCEELVIAVRERGIEVRRSKRLYHRTSSQKPREYIAKPELAAGRASRSEIIRQREAQKRAALLAEREALR